MATTVSITSSFDCKALSQRQLFLLSSQIQATFEILRADKMFKVRNFSSLKKYNTVRKMFGLE